MVARNQLDGSDDVFDDDAGLAPGFRPTRARALGARIVWIFDTVVCAVLFRSSLLLSRAAIPVSAQLLDPVTHAHARSSLAAPSSHRRCHLDTGCHRAGNRDRLCRAPRSCHCLYSAVESTTASKPYA